MNTFSKVQCLDKDWKNPKEIAVKDLAYCIYTYALSINNVPDERKKSVQEEIDKLVKEKDEKENKESIKSVLAIYESDIAKFEFIESGNKNVKLVPDDQDEVISYCFDPELFANVESAQEAKLIVNSLDSSFIRMIYQGGVRFKDSKYNKDIISARKATKRLLKTYEKIGIPRSKVDKAIRSIEWEPKGTIKQELDSYRKNLANQFISLGNTKTNAAEIAKAITSYVSKIYI